MSDMDFLATLAKHLGTQNTVILDYYMGDAAGVHTMRAEASVEHHLHGFTVRLCFIWQRQDMLHELQGSRQHAAPQRRT